MTSTIKVNNVQNQCGQNIINENSNTITIGASGDTVALASGASQTGFGRSGSVNYQTSIKTANFTAVSGEGYFVDTSSGAITVTLPSSPSAGSIVAIVDYAGTSGNNAITIGRNGSNIEGAASDGQIATNREAKTLVYADSTQGWVSVADNTTDTLSPQYIAATGGSVSTVCTNFKVHTFTGPGTFCVSNVGNAAGSNKVSYVIVAGGGGGSYEGGGGAGGFRESRAPTCSYTASPIAITCGGVTVSSGANSIVVGGGASGRTLNAPLTRGSNSSGLGITSAGGGSGKNSGAPEANSCGGSGGGARSGSPSCFQTGAAGNQPPVTPSQGFPGGNFIPAGNPAASSNVGGGGGGATARGRGLTNVDSGLGGDGATSSITGSPVARAGGGGGGVNPPSPSQAGGAGGGGAGDTINGSGGTANTGGGGGGAWSSTGGNGGSGIVIIRYKFQ